MKGRVSNLYNKETRECILFFLLVCLDFCLFDVSLAYLFVYFCLFVCFRFVSNGSVVIFTNLFSVFMSYNFKPVTVPDKVFVCCLLVGCLTSQQHASVSQGRICTDNFTCCHTEIEAADQTFHLTQSQYTDTGPTSPSADPITPGAWQGSHWTANV